MLQSFTRLTLVKQTVGSNRKLLGGLRTMSVTTKDVEDRLKEKLEASHMEVHDTSGGCGASFAVSVVSPQFEGKNLLARHRLINIALQKEMESIHALSIRQVQSQKEYDYRMS